MGRYLILLSSALTMLAGADLQSRPTEAENAWAPKADVTAFLAYDFDQIQQRHGLMDGGYSSEIVHHRIEVIGSGIADSLKRVYPAIADSLARLPDGPQQRYLQAYLNWLVIVCGESITRKDLLDAENRLHSIYKGSSLDKVYRSAKSAYTHGLTGRFAIYLGASASGFVDHTSSAFPMTAGALIGVAFAIDRFGCDLSLYGRRGRVSDSYWDTHSLKPDSLIADIAKISDFSQNRYSVRLTCQLHDGLRWNVTSLVGIQRSSALVQGNNCDIRSGLGYQCGFRLEYILAGFAERKHEKALFGSINSYGIGNTSLTAFAEIDLGRYGVSNPLDGGGSEVWLFLGLKINYRESSMKRQVGTDS